MTLNRRLTLDLRPLVAQAQAKERHRNWCPRCEAKVKPTVDSAGPFCPYCHMDLETPTERSRAQC